MAQAIEPMEPERDTSSGSGGRRPPQDLDAELSVLGGMLLESAAASEVVGLLHRDDFYRRAHGFIFEAMASLYNKSELIDEVTVAAELNAEGKGQAVGGTAFLSSLTDRVPTAANIAFYAQIVRKMSISRRLIQAATDIVKAGYEGKGDIDALMDTAESKIFELSRSREQRGFASLKEAVRVGMLKLEERYNDNRTVTGVATGFADMDRMTSGLQPADLVIIAGRPSMGKTAFALCLAQNAAVLGGMSAAVFSLEMSRDQLAMRMLGCEAQIDGQAMRTGRFGKGDWKALLDAAGNLSKAKVFIDDTGNISVLEMRAKARRLQSEHGLDLIVVDYLQLMRGSSQSEGREKEISEISRGLKALAKELNVPVVALSQLNRSLEQRQDKRPMLSDLRESGAIEQDADVIAFVYRDEYYNLESEDQGIAEIIIGKQRNGPTGTVKLRFIKEHVRFTNLALPAPGFSPDEPPPDEPPPDEPGVYSAPAA